MLSLPVMFCSAEFKHTNKTFTIANNNQKLSSSVKLVMCKEILYEKR